MNSDTMTSEQINALRDYIKSDSGKMFLQLIANREISLKAEAWQRDVTTDRQIQLLNQEYGMYWVRTLIQDLVAPVQRLNIANFDEQNER